MALYAVLFQDNTERADELRQRHMADHLAFLERNAGAIRAAGPLRDAANAPGGGLWLVEAAECAAVEALIHEDPFWATGLRRSVSVLEWTQVFAEGKRRLRPFGR